MAPGNLQDIINKVRRITARPSASQISDAEIINYINTFYVYDFPEHLRLQSLRVNYQFVTNPGQAVYDFDTNYYLTNMPPVYIAGYQSYMTQSRENFFRINPQLQFMQSQIATGNGGSGPYTGTLTNTPIMRGFKPNKPGAYSATTSIAAKDLNWMVLITGSTDPDVTTGIATQYSLVDDGLGNLHDINAANLTTPLGTINYTTGSVSFSFSGNIANGNPINAQYTPYVASRPQSVVFYKDQFMLYPIPDQGYTVSFEAYKYPVEFDGTLSIVPELQEWWQLLAYGAADKIFADNGDLENLQKFRPLLDEQLKLMQRRTIVQQTSERTASIYTEQSQLTQYPFANMF